MTDRTYDRPPEMALDPGKDYHANVVTEKGTVRVRLFAEEAPETVNNFVFLAREGYFDGTTFHRVIEGFMAQGGDPKGDGTGGSDLPNLKAEFNALPHVRGALAAARAEEPDSANSQFFIMLAPRLALDGKYTVYGRVVSGMNHVDLINRGEPPADPTRILQASIAADNRPPLAAAPAPAAAPAVPGAAPAQGATAPQ